MCKRTCLRPLLRYTCHCLHIRLSNVPSDFGSPTFPLAHSLSACVQWSLVEPLMSSLNTLHRARVVGPPAKTESRHKHWSLSDLPPIAALLCATKFICNLCYQPLFVHACVCISVVICLEEQVTFWRWVLWEWVLTLCIFNHFYEPMFPVFTARTNVVSTLVALSCLRQHTESGKPRILPQMFWVSVDCNKQTVALGTIFSAYSFLKIPFFCHSS